MIVTVLSTPRTASSYFCEYLSTKYNIPNYKETLVDFDREQSTTQFNELLNETQSGVFKMFIHAQTKHLNYVLVNSDKIYYLIRKDTDAQVKSMLCAKHKNPNDPWDPASFERTQKTNNIIDITVSQEDFDYYIKFCSDMNSKLLKYHKHFPGKIIYTEDIVADNFDPYGQQYNFKIV